MTDRPCVLSPPLPRAHRLPTSTSEEKEQKKRPKETAKQREAVAALDALLKEVVAFPSNPMGVLTLPSGNAVLFNVSDEAGAPPTVLPQPVDRTGAWAGGTWSAVMWAAGIDAGTSAPVLLLC